MVWNEVMHRQRSQYFLLSQSFFHKIAYIIFIRFKKWLNEMFFLFFYWCAKLPMMLLLMLLLLLLSNNVDWSNFNLENINFLSDNNVDWSPVGWQLNPPVIKNHQKQEKGKDFKTSQSRTPYTTWGPLQLDPQKVDVIVIKKFSRHFTLAFPKFILTNFGYFWKRHLASSVKKQMFI